jgi:uncharacterized protein (DUF2235 family)
MKEIIFSLLILVVVSGCATSEYITHPHQKEAAKVEVKKIAVFFDGTSNTANSSTNVVKLYNLVTLQPRNDIQSMYIKGVGTEGGWTKQLFGMATGLGIGEDVRQAYRYLGNTYTKGSKDEIYLFGFSRGSYSARILAGMIYTAGLADLKGINEKEQVKLVEKIYDAYKGDRSLEARRKSISTIDSVRFTNPRISFMGVWDTVEALGLPNRTEKIEEVNGRYVDQLCNIDKAAHALSIDDNRAKIFTPIALTSKSLIEDCNEEVSIDNVVNEVWFAGAHADVGGGYENTELSGVSLNWMIEQMRGTGLLSKEAKVLEDSYGISHNPSAGFFDLIYENRNRNLPDYITKTGYNKGIIKVHESVFERLAKIPKLWQEFDWISEGSDEYQRNFPECFEKTEQDDGKYTLKYNEQKSCFYIVKRK